MTADGLFQFFGDVFMNAQLELVVLETQRLKYKQVRKQEKEKSTNQIMGQKALSENY